MKNFNLLLTIGFSIMSCNSKAPKHSENKSQIPTIPTEITEPTKDSIIFEIEKLSKPKSFIKEYSKEAYLEYKKNNFYDEVLEKTSNIPKKIISFGENPFLESMVCAYQDHRPFRISPDIIWVLINQGFARHISFNDEKYRNYFVNFEGKKDLYVDATKYIKLGNPKSNWEKAFQQLTNQTTQYIDKSLINNLTADFSTTTETSKFVSQITILEAFKGYFNYEIDGRGCGIPKIIIEGSVADWEKVLEKTKYISKYDLQWWTDKLVVILNEIINAKKGNFDKSFWMNMVKYHTKNEYGAFSEITGWVVDFYPYFNDGQRTNFKPISDTSMLPTEYVQVPFIFKDKNMNLELKMNIRAGFIGVTQDKNDYTLTPEIGWFLTYKNKNEDTTE